MVFTDIMSEASLGAGTTHDDNTASVRSRHVIRSGRSVVPSRTDRAGDIVGDCGAGLGVPTGSMRSSSSRSYGTGFISRGGVRSNRSMAVPTASSRTSVSVRLVEVAPEVTKGHDAVRPQSVASRRTQTALSQLSPFDSVSIAGHAKRGRDPEFVPEQQAVNAAEPSDRLAFRLAEVSSRISPAVRDRVLSSAQCSEVSGGSPSTATTYRPPSVHPSRAAASLLGSRSGASKIVMSRDILADIAGTQVCDDINLRVVRGHNIIVLRDGASLEVVDENGDAIDSVDIKDRAHRQTLGFPPLTPRDLHDALKSGTEGKYGVVRRGDALVVVRANRGSSAMGSGITGPPQCSAHGSRGLSVASHLLRHF
ncbi:hypothetical protein [Penicillium janthinellum polymycovirus 1]|nr:hypothetical protein [Penicillium janthinellum polymycovirus 1]